MEKTLRCTVCSWRGLWTEAQFAPRVRRSEIPGPIESLQAAYAEKQRVAEELVGQPKPPPCPSCGHHTRVVPRRHSFRPSAT